MISSLWHDSHENIYTIINIPLLLYGRKKHLYIYIYATSACSICKAVFHRYSWTSSQKSQHTTRPLQQLRPWCQWSSGWASAARGCCTTSAASTGEARDEIEMKAGDGEDGRVEGKKLLYRRVEGRQNKVGWWFLMSAGSLFVGEVSLPSCWVHRSGLLRPSTPVKKENH